MQLAHVVLLEPAARVGRVPVRRPVQVVADILASPRPQQLLAPRVLPQEAGEVVEASPAADPASAGRQALLDLGGGEGGGGGRSGDHGGRPERAARSPGVCSAAAQRASNIPGAADALTGRPPPHLLICMRRSHWPRRGTLPQPEGPPVPIGPREAGTRAGRAGRCGHQPRGAAQVEGAPARCAPSPGGSLGGGRLRAEPAFQSVSGDGTGIAGGRIAPALSLLLLLPGEKVAVSHPRAAGGGGEDAESGRRLERGGRGTGIPDIIRRKHV